MHTMIPLTSIAVGAHHSLADFRFVKGILAEKQCSAGIVLGTLLSPVLIAVFRPEFGRHTLE